MTGAEPLSVDAIAERLRAALTRVRGLEAELVAILEQLDPEPAPSVEGETGAGPFYSERST